MKYVSRILAATVALVIWNAGAAYAWNVHGRVVCASNGVGLIGVQVVVTTGAQQTMVITDSDGYYTVDLDAAFPPEAVPRTYNVFLNSASLPSDALITIPAGGSYTFATTVDNSEFEENFTVSTAQCTQSVCWMTGGGAKIDPILNIPVAEKGSKENFGGNVNPSCSALPGDGGNWNHLSRGSKLHFQGQHIEVVRCGNVPGIPPGSGSPSTPYNYIEFRGTGRLDGFAGNKASYPLVYFYGRVEDRNEPGSSANDDGALIDRYFLNVFSNPNDPAGSSLLLSDGDGKPDTLDPAAITHGNLQIHISSCSQQ